MSLSRLFKVVVLLIVLGLAFPSAAAAYLDPGTGSYVLQLALAAVVALGFLVKVYWKKIRSFLARLFSALGRRSREQREKDEGD
jgi:hypothetical protein